MMGARDKLDAEPIATVDVIDVVAHAIKLYGGRERAEEMLPEFARPMPEHDYRFEVRRESGAEVTFHAGATAQHVAEYFAREGWTAKDATTCVCCNPGDCGDRRGHVRMLGDRTGVVLCNCGRDWPCEKAAAR